MNVVIRRLARQEPGKKSLFFRNVLLCPMAEGQGSVHVQRVAEFLITVPENLCPTKNYWSKIGTMVLQKRQLFKTWDVHMVSALHSPTAGNLP